jgi:methyl-accepting chemotaxis protein
MPSKVDAKKDRVIAIVLVLHFVIIFFYSFLTDHLHIISVAVVALLLPLLTCYLKPGSLLSRSFLALGLIADSAILIHLSNGLVEIHFHLFIILVLLSIYYDWKVIVFAGAAISLHHLYGLLDQHTYLVYAPNPNIVIYLLHILFVVLESIVLCYQTQVSRRNLATISQQNATLKQLLAQTETKRELGEVMSQRIKSVSSQLTVTSTQQASGSQQQVSALSEVISALLELNATARNISTSTGEINQAAREVLHSVKEVKTTTGAVTEVVSRGIMVVDRSFESNSQVNRFYGELVERLNDLNHRSAEMKTISALLKNISDETHLLALNALIEAAGAGQYGERFGVVAQQVKELANRSIKASNEVNRMLNEVEARITEAVETVESGYSQTDLALSIARQSREVIDELAQTIEASVNEVDKIQDVVSVMTDLTEDISRATAQQQQASGQVVEALQDVDSIARQTASGSAEVRNTTVSLEQLSEELQKALAA